jgi:hypothetical protein
MNIGINLEGAPLDPSYPYRIKSSSILPLVGSFDMVIPFECSRMRGLNFSSQNCLGDKRLLLSDTIGEY